ncbi:unnamed protein product [Clavelina lepadiformis]|uniref:Uncharacterized protein n=1 Tax=Clavelina lepadiformis TaxID=159417 RepID=A0ABP0GZG6_CLALP
MEEFKLAIRMRSQKKYLNDLEGICNKYKSLTTDGILATADGTLSYVGEVDDFLSSQGDDDCNQLNDNILDKSVPSFSNPRRKYDIDNNNKTNCFDNYFSSFCHSLSESSSPIGKQKKICEDHLYTPLTPIDSDDSFSGSTKSYVSIARNIGNGVSPKCSTNVEFETTVDLTSSKSLKHVDEEFWNKPNSDDAFSFKYLTQHYEEDYDPIAEERFTSYSTVTSGSYFSNESLFPGSKVLPSKHKNNSPTKKVALKSNSSVSAIKISPAKKSNSSKMGTETNFVTAVSTALLPTDKNQQFSATSWNMDYPKICLTPVNVTENFGCKKTHKLPSSPNGTASLPFHSSKITKNIAKLEGHLQKGTKNTRRPLNASTQFTDVKKTRSYKRSRVSKCSSKGSDCCKANGPLLNSLVKENDYYLRSKRPDFPTTIVNAKRMSTKNKRCDITYKTRKQNILTNSSNIKHKEPITLVERVKLGNCFIDTDILFCDHALDVTEKKPDLRKVSEHKNLASSIVRKSRGKQKSKTSKVFAKRVKACAQPKKRHNLMESLSSSNEPELIAIKNSPSFSKTSIKRRTCHRSQSNSNYKSCLMVLRSSHMALRSGLVVKRL